MSLKVRAGMGAPMVTGAEGVVPSIMNEITKVCIGTSYLAPGDYTGGRPYPTNEPDPPFNARQCYFNALVRNRLSHAQGVGPRCVHRGLTTQSAKYPVSR